MTELVDRLGMIKRLDGAIGPIKTRDRGFTGGELLVGLASAQLAGEDFLVGLDRRRADVAGQVLAPVAGLSSTTLPLTPLRTRPGPAACSTCLAGTTLGLRDLGPRVAQRCRFADSNGRSLPGLRTVVVCGVLASSCHGGDEDRVLYLALAPTGRRWTRATPKRIRTAPPRRLRPVGSLRKAAPRATETAGTR